MKKIALTVLYIVMFVALSYSQDTITMKTGEMIRAKVLEVSITDVKYKKFDYLDGPTYTTLKSEIFTIRYQNGSLDNFAKAANDSTANSATTKTSATETDFFLKGQRDARIHYDGYEGAGTVTLISSLLSPLIGLAPAIVCSSTTPKDKNLNYPKPELMKNTRYSIGYLDKAKKIKQGKVWMNWGIGFGVNLIAVLLLLNEP